MLRVLVQWCQLTGQCTGVSAWCWLCAPNPLSPTQVCTCIPQQTRNGTNKKAGASGLGKGVTWAEEWVLVLRGTHKPGVCPWASVQVLHACSEHYTEPDGEHGVSWSESKIGSGVPLTMPAL